MKIDAATAQALAGVTADWDAPSAVLTATAPAVAITNPKQGASDYRPAPRGVSASWDTQYTVVPGDTLGKIANRYGVTTGALASANGIANINLIRVGQVLTIPAAMVPNEGTAAWRTIPGPADTRQAPVAQQAVPTVAAPAAAAAAASGASSPGAGGGSKSLTDLLNSDPLGVGVPAWALGGGLLAVVGVTMATQGKGR